jgi:hypothetical protein
MMSNAGPLTDIPDCYPKAQTFLPDSADRPKTICISPVDYPQELAYPEAVQLLATPSLSAALSSTSWNVTSPTFTALFEL